MEISYLSAIIFSVAAFGVFAFLAFRGSRRAIMESGSEAGVKDARSGTLCHECLGASNLDKQRMAECSSACGLMPE